MGTNYFIQRICFYCGHIEKEHIGKVSAGWTFTFRARPLIRDYDAWRINLDSANSIIDEYNKRHTVEHMVDIVMDRVNAPRNHAIEEPSEHTFLDKYGNAFNDIEFC